ncbi:hypothetical protein BDV95DRAFT_625216 [Massariosphaeria phaeospora]|uniref:Subtilisin-like serine protease protein n=1 Tax=Massariosphaeria phaeospora TaxID=100035 RepID=A0A7C8MFW3_9PLEO|nr:hypothetical protein BDV95DRAFT_625216 [Massariosphaeria phaeospora]
MYEKDYPFLTFLPPETSSRRAENGLAAHASLPGYSDLSIDSIHALTTFLLDELQCRDLDQISHRLWLMSTQSSANIAALHRQRVRGREIVITEETKLHLIWFYDKIHIKPLPTYLLSTTFWNSHLLSGKQPFGRHHETIVSSALGLLRSYAHLIIHESDFRIAKDRATTLIPESITWDQWRLLRSSLLAIRDEDVSGRFRFGEIRLTRLNFYCKFLLARTYYYRTHRQYGDYFASFYPPLLFLFGIVSIMLGSMQLAATLEGQNEQWPRLLGLFRMFGVMIMGVTFLILIILVALFTVKIVREWIYALRCRYLLQGRSAGFSSAP